MEQNEEEMLSLLIASERVGAWLDTIRGFRVHGSIPRCKQAIRDLLHAMECESYAEEVRTRLPCLLSCAWSCF